MEAKFYPEVFARAGLTIITPNETERAFVNEKYFGGTPAERLSAGNARSIAGNHHSDETARRD
jgi:aspartate/glutamate racemase